MMVMDKDDNTDFAAETYKLSSEEFSPPQPTMMWGTLAEDDFRLDLQVGDDNIRVPLIADKIFILGRDQSTKPLGNMLNIDLTNYNAIQQGVSRYHAGLQLEKSLLFVTDLESTNGTWLNGEPLPPYQKRLVRDGDELQLGNLIIKLSFSH